MQSSEITPIALKIDRLLKRIEEGDIKIPSFQRGYVWKQNQVIDLLDSIRKDYPIGSVLLWNSSERLEATRNIAGFLLPDRDATYPVNYVLDGQQRLATIYAVFSSAQSQEQTASPYSPDSATFDLFFDFNDDTIKTADEVGEHYDRGHIARLRNFLDPATFLDEFQSLGEVVRPAARALHSKFLNYEIPVVTIRGRTKEEVGLIFERINNTGTRLGMMDLMVAWTWSEDFHLKDALSQVMESLDEKGFGDLPSRIMLQAISGVVQDTTKSKAVLELDASAVREQFAAVQTAMELAVDFLATDLGCTSTDFLPHVQQLVPLTRFFHANHSPSAEQLRALRRWFWATSFSRRYSAQTDDKMDADIQVMLRILRNDTTGVDEYAHNVDPSILVATVFRKAHPYVRAFLLLMARQTPLDMVKASAIDTGTALSQFNRKQYHHVFPKAFLRTREVAPDRINSLMNFCFLPADSNRRISQKRPSSYVFSMIPNDSYQTILASNLLPLNRDLYRQDDYDQFLISRASQVTQKIDELVSG